MKKNVMVLVFLCAIFFSAKAQEISNNAIGVRISEGFSGVAPEISYQKKVRTNNRLELNLKLQNSINDLEFVGLYEWVWNIKNNFNWYAGPGIGFRDFSRFPIFLTGVIGVEYNFTSPLLLSIDYRPETNRSNLLNANLGFSLKYQF